jgi:hypothetical protein
VSDCLWLLLLLLLLADAVVSALSLSQGPEGGNSVVTVSGANFVSSPNLMCRFGRTQVSASAFIDSGRVVCQTPSAAQVGTVQVSISNNNQDYSVQNVVFTYQGMIACSLAAL